MKNNDREVFIIVGGLFALCVFIGIVAYNFLPNNEKSSSYYVKVNDNINAKIEKLYVENSILTLETTGANEYCVKTTKSIPNSNSICWKKIENDITKVNIYSYKKYYVWIKDIDGNISKEASINS